MGMEKATEIVLTWELYEQGLSKSAIARRLGRNRETVILWIKKCRGAGSQAILGGFKTRI
jgi:transposase